MDLKNTQSTKKTSSPTKKTPIDSLRGYQFVLPFRVLTQNLFWENDRRGHRRISDAGKAYREMIILHTKSLLNQGKIWYLGDARLQIHYVFHCKTWHRLDTFNGEKPLTDSFEKILFDNDEQVDDGHLTRIYGAVEDKIVVNISPIPSLPKMCKISVRYK